MASYNKVIIIGNLTRDPEVRYTPRGSAVAELSLAVNRTYTADNGEKREEVTFVDVTLWGKTAELAGQYLKKGSPLMVDGRLQTDSWEDKATGQKRSKLKVVGESMQFLGGKQEGGEQRQQAKPQQQRQVSKPEEIPAESWGDDDIPF